MATCADCVHVEACHEFVKGLAAARGLKLGSVEEISAILQSDDCEQFKDRARFVDLPCKVGDILFVPTRNFISEYKIDYFHVGAYGIWFNTTLIAGISTHLRSENIESIGKTVFLTREEAEQALKKERESNGQSEN